MKDKIIRNQILFEENRLFVSPTILHIPNLKMDQKILLQLIISLDNGDGGGCYASDLYLGKRLNCSRRKIQRKLRGLEDGGYIFRKINGFKRYIHPKYTLFNIT